MKNLNFGICSRITDYGLRATIFALCLCATLVKSDMHYVSMTGGNVSPYSSAVNAATDIQNAIDVAEDGDVVLVDDGVYFPPNQLVLMNDIILKSVNGAYKTTIDGSNSHGVVFIRNAEAVVEGFTITHGNGFWGGGVYIIKTGTIERCIISNNKAANGGGIYLNEGGLVRNSLIISNSVSSTAGGIYMRFMGKAINCTIVGNSAGINAGGVDLNGYYSNCIIWDNYSAGKTNNYYYQSHYNGTSEFCCTFPIIPGKGHVDLPPEFLPGNYYLNTNSPCINTGTNYPEMTNWFDLAYNRRIMDGRVDMGCFEVVGGILVSGKLKWKQKKTKTIFKWTEIEPLMKPFLELGYNVILKDGTNIIDGSHSLSPNKSKVLWKFKDKVAKISVKYKEKNKWGESKTKLIFKLPGQLPENTELYLTK